MRENCNFIFLRLFPRTGRGIYRIDWFGDVTHTSHNGGRTPMVQIVASRWPTGESTPISRNHANRFTNITFPIAYLRLFRIGDLWNGGRQIGTDDQSAHEIFWNLEINENTVSVAPAGLPIHPDGTAPLYPLPFSTFEAHRDHTGAFCARVRVADDITLVVPCMELIRFYFGSSGSLLKQLFSGAMAGSKLYSAAKINPATGIACLDLAPNLPGVAACTVGRIAFDDQARKAMRWLINSGVSAAANRERHYPRTTFPFKGTTNLTAHGRWIELPGHRVFLAERLVRCSHPFPFRKLFYTSHMDLAATRQAVRRAIEEQTRLQGKTNNPSFTLTEARVARDLQPAMVTAMEDDDCPFPDLLNKPVRRIKADHPFFARKRADQQDNLLAAGEMSTTSDIRGAEITTESIEQEVEESYPPGVLLVQDTCHGLCEEGHDYVRLLPARMDSTNDETIFMRSTELTPSNDQRLDRIWAARLLIKAPGIEPSLLVLIKEKESWWGENSGDQAIMFPYSPDADPHGITLKKRLIEFADMPRGPDPAEGTVKGELQIGSPGGASRMMSFLTWVWGMGHYH